MLLVLLRHDFTSIRFLHDDTVSDNTFFVLHVSIGYNLWSYYFLQMFEWDFDGLPKHGRTLDTWDVTNYFTVNTVMKSYTFLSYH